MKETANADFPLDLADRCVKCGLCLPHCPTYQVTQDEAESPRGRIALMQGLATGMLEQSAQLEKHLDQCLACRACEPVCPAQVPYGELIDRGRAMLEPGRQSAQPVSSRLLSAVLVRNRLRKLFGWGLWLYQRLGLQWLIRRLHLLGNGGMARTEALLPRVPMPRRLHSRKARGTRGRVALFSGCVSEWLESDVLQDAVAVLDAIGFTVEIPATQGCCGALYQHNGETERAKRLAECNIRAFAGDHDAIVGIASGCTSMLAEYNLVSDEGKPLADKTGDISHFLARHWPHEAQLRPLNARIAVHDPCSLRNVLQQADSPYTLLKSIPGAEILPLDDNPTCCGAAGNYFINQPAMADTLGRKKSEAIAACRPDMVVTSNVGCAMQLKAQLRQAGLDIPVMHPVSVIRRQLP